MTTIVYVSNADSGDISVLHLNADSGALTLLQSFATGGAGEQQAFENDGGGGDGRHVAGRCAGMLSDGPQQNGAP